MAKFMISITISGHTETLNIIFKLWSPLDLKYGKPFEIIG